MVSVNLGDIVPVSTIDWRGKTAMVIFLRGCPLNCIYCQNAQILAGSNYVNLEDLEAASNAEADKFSNLWNYRDLMEGITAFNERRRPEFKGE